MSLGLISCLFMNSCGGDKTDAQQNSTHSETIVKNDSSKIGSGISDGNSFPISLKERSDLFCKQVFTGDFQRGSLQESDLTEHFPDERENDFRRFISMKEVKNSTGRGIYPRAIFMATRFQDEAALKKNLESWIQAMKKDEPQVELGLSIKAVKTAPFVATTLGNDVFILKSSCLYSSSAWEKLKTNFINAANEFQSGYLFQVTCESKNLDYLK